MNDEFIVCCAHRERRLTSPSALFYTERVVLSGDSGVGGEEWALDGQKERGMFVDMLGLLLPSLTQAEGWTVHRESGLERTWEKRKAVTSQLLKSMHFV